LPHIARTCEPFALDDLVIGSGASEPPPDGLEGVPLELGETVVLGDGEASGVDVAPEGALGVTGGAASGVPKGVLGVAGGVASGIAPEGALGVAGGAASGIAPDGGAAEGVLGGITEEGFGVVGTASVGCA
jgi:hypothetical protein